jgi:hypothetical protein
MKCRSKDENTTGGWGGGGGVAQATVHVSFALPHATLVFEKKLRVVGTCEDYSRVECKKEVANCVSCWWGSYGNTVEEDACSCCRGTCLGVTVCLSDERLVVQGCSHVL